MTKRAVYLSVVLFWLLGVFFGMADSRATEVDMRSGPMGFDNVDGDRVKGTDYLPYYPTAATIWPRTVQVPCKVIDGLVVCQGYSWTPAQGRGEYLFIEPVMEDTPKCETIIIESAKQETVVERIVETPQATVVKKKKAPLYKPKKKQQCK